MKTKRTTEIKMTVRDRACGTEDSGFQAHLEPNEVIEGKDLFERFGEFCGFTPAKAEMCVIMLDHYIESELLAGNQVNLPSVIFYPRLSKALKKRNSSPEAEGVQVRGAVKATRKLVGLLKDKLRAVNVDPEERSFINNILDSASGKYDHITIGASANAVGLDINVIAGREDEGVWLEKRTHKGRRQVMVKVQRGRVIKCDRCSCEFVFDTPVPKGVYYVVIESRVKGADTRDQPNRARRLVRIS